MPGWAFHNWPVGLMDKASAPGAGDSRFESWAGHYDALFEEKISQDDRELVNIPRRTPLQRPRGGAKARPALAREGLPHFLGPHPRHG